MNKDEENGFYAGVMIALVHLHCHDASSYAVEIASAVGWDKLKEVPKRTESEQDVDVIKWLENDL